MKRPFLSNRRLLSAITALALLSGVIAASVVRADRSTPFVEGNTKVGTRSKEHGFVVSLDGKEFKTFVVLVRTDTEEFVAIRATAEADVVKSELLGRPVLVDGEIVTRETGRDGKVRVSLKIHGVELPPQPGEGRQE